MSNIFQQNKHKDFSWDKLGDIEKGRMNLGTEVPVVVYRLLEYSMNDILHKEFGEEKADEIFRKAGYLAGSEFAKNNLNLSDELNVFISKLQTILRELKIGVLRIEKYESESGNFVLTIGEDLDCSGLPVSKEVICVYDEGFLEGIMETYTKKPYCIREIDCWASGDRVCRFKGEVAL